MIEIERSSRKTLQIQIKQNGNVLIKTPLYTRQSTIDRFLKQNSAWIERKQSELLALKNQFNISPGEEVPYRGKRYILQLSNNKTVNIEGDYLYVPQSENYREILKKWYIEQARREITEVVDFYSSKLNIPYNKIYIKSQKSRWGSCSGRRNLNFNWKIILLKEELLYYLVIHEVMHLLEMNHSYRFWDLVKTFDPKYREHREKLQEYSYLLLYFLND